VSLLHVPRPSQTKLHLYKHKKGCVRISLYTAFIFIIQILRKHHYSFRNILIIIQRYPHLQEVSCLYKHSGRHQNPQVSQSSYQWSHAAQE